MEPHLTRYLPEADWFRHNPYGIHGVAHAARVLVWSDTLAARMGGPLRSEELRWAAACHDVGRVNDWTDPEHPARAAAWVAANLAALRPEAAAGFDLAFVAELCRWHTERDDRTMCRSPELDILKDADALDRARLGDLDPNRLRLARAHDLIEPAARLFEATGSGPQATGLVVLAMAERLLGSG
ncbi:MAG: HD domain-containing protein [Thermomicrobiales bacterium]|nr:HD domain-containing protein [Thermomicrobiales bacterium]